MKLSKLSRACLSTATSPSSDAKPHSIPQFKKTFHVAVLLLGCGGHDQFGSNLLETTSLRIALS
jgi:hypothetical protein